jgi:uncharacterized repeat protein (TIGR01451 family)
LQLQDGTDNLGTLAFSFPLGKPVSILSQNFDTGVTVPALPSGWTTTTSGGAVAWVTSSTTRDTTPNSAYAAESTSNGVAELLSPVIPISSSVAQLSFRNSFNCETDPALLTNSFDGGVLELKIGAGPFMDILAAGGSFVTNGYNRTIGVTNTDNPLFGRQAWSGLSGGFISTIVNLPVAAAGQSVQFKWRFATDNGNFYGGFGWYIDGVAVTDGYACCSSSADLAVTQAGPSNPVILGGNITYTLAVSNLGPALASSVTVTDILPANVTFVSATVGTTNLSGAVISQLGSVSTSTATNFSIVVTPLAAGLFTNSATLSSSTSDPASANNSALQIAVVMTPPVLTNLSLGSTAISLSLASLKGVNYQLEYKNLLTDPNWTALIPLFPGTGGAIVLQDTNAPPSLTRFYRVRCLNGF